MGFSISPTKLKQSLLKFFILKCLTLEVIPDKLPLRVLLDSGSPLIV